MTVLCVLFRRISMSLLAVLVACACLAGPGTLAKGKSTKKKEKVTAKEKEADKEKKKKEKKVLIEDEDELLIMVNNADAKALRALRGVGKKLAVSIIAGRPYKTLDGLLEVKGIAKKTMDKIKGSIDKVKVPASALVEKEKEEDEE
ncbi:MAG: helix-hairpin-helix domain-containing protein [Victivallales bacterium]|nr:helix-hairpin-helix domain-containing protein [Victivallales bacterium]